MKINKDDITKVAQLARLKLTDIEKEEFSQQLSDIIEYVEKINTMDTNNVKPADHIVDLKNVFRKDESGGSINRDEIQKIAPQFDKGHFIVPKIIDGV